MRRLTIGATLCGLLVSGTAAGAEPSNAAGAVAESGDYLSAAKACWSVLEDRAVEDAEAAVARECIERFRKKLGLIFLTAAEGSAARVDGEPVQLERWRFVNPGGRDVVFESLDGTLRAYKVELAAMEAWRVIEATGVEQANVSGEEGVLLPGKVDEGVSEGREAGKEDEGVQNTERSHPTALAPPAPTNIAITVSPEVTAAITAEPKQRATGTSANWYLMTLGVVVAAAGSGVAIWQHVREDESWRLTAPLGPECELGATKACDAQNTYAGRIESAERWQLISWIGAGVGAAVVGLSVLPPFRLGVEFDSESAFVSGSGRF